MHGERGEQFGFAAGLEAEMEFRAGIDHFLDDFAELVDLDRENAAVDVFVSRFGDRFGEGAVDGLHAVAEQILEAQGERKGEAAFARFVHEFHHVDLAQRLAARTHRDVAFAVDREIRSAPTLDIVERESGGDIPIVHFRERANRAICLRVQMEFSGNLLWPEPAGAGRLAPWKIPNCRASNTKCLSCSSTRTAEA